MSVLSGITITSKQSALSALLPNATDVWVGLLTSLPSASTGLGAVEASTLTGYERVAHDAWLNVTDGDNVLRKNDGTITFPTLVGVLVGVVGWAIWDAATDGNMIAFGPQTDSGGDPISKDFVIGDDPQFATQELSVSLEQGA